jgi:hypothetical protein
MRYFLAAVSSVIAVGVMLIAYGLLVPRVAASDAGASWRQTLTADRAGYVEDLTPRPAIAYPVSALATASRDEDFRADRAGDLRLVRAKEVRSAPVVPRRVAPTRVARSSDRDWKRTAMVIGGSTAAGAGLGAIFGGKKGALIGAALGGGAGTLFEVRGR